MLFETLSDRLTGIFQRLGAKGRLTERDVDAALREVRVALLEADVNFRVVRDLLSRVRDRAVGVELLKSVNPAQHVVKVAHEELTAALGGAARRLEPAARPPSVALLVGLNGSGKTTTAAKLANHLKEAGQRPLLVAADLRRPAAVQQLQVLAERAGVPIHVGDPSFATSRVAAEGVRRGADLAATWAIVDTSGRFQIDEELMAELVEVRDAVSPTETLLVVDAMTGQDAVRVAEAFHAKIGLTGLVLTKLDGDARGGAALSISSVTGVPVKFIGTGEALAALEPFHPERLASRVLGMGDVLTLVEKAQKAFDVDQATELMRKVRRASFDLNDFLGQLQQLKKMGPLSQVLEMVPGFSSLKRRVASEDLEPTRLKTVEAIIYSMTPAERANPGLIDGSRRRRVAAGSGTTPQDVNQLLNQFRDAQRMMRMMTSAKGRRRAMRMFQ